MYIYTYIDHCQNNDKENEMKSRNRCEEPKKYFEIKEDRMIVKECEMIFKKWNQRFMIMDIFIDSERKICIRT